MPIQFADFKGLSGSFISSMIRQRGAQTTDCVVKLTVDK